MRRELTRRDYLLPLLGILDSRTASKATSPAYTTGSWVLARIDEDEQQEQRLQIGSMAAGWAANILEDVLGESVCRARPASHMG